MKMFWMVTHEEKAPASRQTTPSLNPRPSQKKKSKRGSCKHWTHNYNTIQFSYCSEPNLPKWIYFNN